MARYAKFFSVGGGGGTNNLQLPVGTILDATLRQVQDGLGTGSPLYVSINSVQVQSTLKITTNSDPYIDAEDGLGNNRFTVGRDTSSQQVNIDFASNPGGSTTDVGAIRTYANGVNLSEVVKFREDGQVTFVERVNVEADSLVTTQISSVIAASTTNANLIIAPNGTGALIASIPDGTVTGGNARGTNAVDLQQSRTLNTQIALNNFSFIGGGKNNKVDAVYGSNEGSVIVGGVSNSNAANYAFIGGGANNQLSGNDNFQVIVGGDGNGITASGCSFIGGGRGNLIGGSGTGYKVISGGQGNSANGGTHATVVGGESNVSSGAHSVSGGQSNTASGLRSVALGYSNIASSEGSVALGFNNNATGYTSFVIGSDSTASNFYSGVLGYLSNATAMNSFAIGQQANAIATNSIAFMGGICQATNSVAFQGGLSQAEQSFSFGNASYGYLLGMNAFSNGNFGGPLKTIQHSFILAKKEAVLNASGTTILSLDGTGTTNLIIPTNGDSGSRRFWNVTVEYVAFCVSVGAGTTIINEMAIGTDKFLFKRIATSTIGAITNIQQSAETSMVGSICTYAVGGSNDLQITFVAPSTANGTTFRVAAKVSLVELS